MLSRRIVVGVCTLSLAIPAAAGASAGTNPPSDRGGTGPPSTVSPKDPYGTALGGPPSTPYGNPAAGTTGTVKAKGPYGVPATGGPATVKAKGPYGRSPAGPTSTVKAKGPYGIPAPGPRSTVKAKGPYGVPAGPASQSIPAATTHTSATPLRGETNDWRTAALIEAALLAALLLGWALLVPARHRAGHMAT